MVFFLFTVKGIFYYLIFITIYMFSIAFLAIETLTVFAKPGYIKSQQVQSMCARSGQLLEMFMTFSRDVFKKA